MAKALLLTLLGGLPAFAAAADKPNLLVIVADDLGYADVSFHSRHPREVSTPHLDALARAGVICRQGYVTGNVCSPTRAGLMTGRYQQRCGIYTAGEGGSGLPLAERIFPQFLKTAGYVSGAFGKWHLGLTPEYNPAARGFDAFYGFLGRGAHDYFKLDDPDSPLYRNLEIIRDQGYLTDRLGDEAAAFIARHADRPFFAYLAFNAVHTPLQAPADEIAKFDTGDANRNTILAMGKRLDDAVGRVVGTLRQKGIWEQTLTFFISDNGGALQQTSNNAPLRGGKHQDYEGGVRVPFLVCWPDRLKAGTEYPHPVISLDILPTALAAAGVAPPADKPLDGVDLLPLLRGEAQPEPRTFFWCSATLGKWWAIRDGDWKLVSNDRHQIGLFDLGRDVSEQTDLADQYPEKVAALRKRHDAWLDEMAEPRKAGPKRVGTPGPQKATGAERDDDREPLRQERRNRRRGERNREPGDGTGGAEAGG